MKSRTPTPFFSAAKALLTDVDAEPTSGVRGVKTYSIYILYVFYIYIYSIYILYIFYIYIFYIYIIIYIYYIYIFVFYIYIIYIHLYSIYIVYIYIFYIFIFYIYIFYICFTSCFTKQKISGDRMVKLLSPMVSSASLPNCHWILCTSWEFMVINGDFTNQSRDYELFWYRGKKENSSRKHVEFYI